LEEHDPKNAVGKNNIINEFMCSNKGKGGGDGPFTFGVLVRSLWGGTKGAGGTRGFGGGKRVVSEILIGQEILSSGLIRVSYH